MTIEDRAKSDFRHCLTVTILLSSIENQYELTYQGVSYLSFDKAFDSELGFDDLLIDECILEEDVFVHELTFVGNIAWMIKSKEIHIRGTH